MFSDMGDGSTDRKTIEQEILYVRYPTYVAPPTHPTLSLSSHTLPGLSFSITPKPTHHNSLVSCPHLLGCRL